MFPVTWIWYQYDISVYICVFHMKFQTVFLKNESQCFRKHITEGVARITNVFLPWVLNLGTIIIISLGPHKHTHTHPLLSASVTNEEYGHYQSAVGCDNLEVYQPAARLFSHPPPDTSVFHPLSFILCLSSSVFPPLSFILYIISTCPFPLLRQLLGHPLQYILLIHRDHPYCNLVTDKMIC